MFHRRTLCVAFFVGLTLAGCDRATEPEAPAISLAAGGAQVAAGGGIYDLVGVFPINFHFSAVVTPSGQVNGSFRQIADVGTDHVDISGRVTCLAVDAANGRAWIGAVVTENNSNPESGLQEANHQPGRDVWFRVLDTGPGSSDPDRTTFLGFEGGGGIITSAEYCEAQIWPDGNARTHPVSSGGIKVK